MGWALHGSAWTSWTGPWVQELRQLDIPLGAVPIGIGLGVLLYFVLLSLAERPFSIGAGTVRMVVLEEIGPTSPEWMESAGVTSDVPKVQVYSTEGDRTVRMIGAGASPSVPLPRASRFVYILLLAFVAMAVVLLYFYRTLFGGYDHLVGLVGAFVYWPIPWPGVYAIGPNSLIVPDYVFPMYLAGMVAFALASGLITNRPALGRHRRLLALSIVLIYVGLQLVIDSLFFTVYGADLRDFALIIRAFTGGLFLALLTFCTFYLPEPQQLAARVPRNQGAIVTFLGLGVLAIIVSALGLLVAVELLRVQGIALDFTLLLLLPVLTLPVFCAMARPIYHRAQRRRPLPPLSQYHPSVSIIIPAYNEAEWIGEAIRSADHAAGMYPGPVEIIVGNDGSTDRTVEFARKAIGELQHTRGMVVDLPHGGKSNALNGALAMATGEIVLRLDGDTVISEKVGFGEMIRHFADPTVGGVQGAIHPRQRNGWTRKLRALEIAWMHYMLRPATMGTSSAEVIDGLFSAFRRKDLVELGGYVPWNGEDSEMSIRIQRLGYQIRIEFGALAYEDVPGNYQSLRRQRVRWARGILMANGQHYTALLGPTPEYGGLAILFWFLLVVRSGVRSLVFVFLGLLILILGVPALEYAAVLVGIAILIRGIPLSYFLVKMKRSDVLPWIVFFPFGNLIKQSFRFEAFGTLGPGASREYV
ncbi:MAG: glycosyltransferase [Thermoplasmata archaeon]|nr:glycosyltransferase [Thermoplasmata archaeon]